jgi:predicted membrane-bound spermidine synthase
VNTAGAFLGALAASFYLIPKLGLPGTVRATALLNLGAALLFFALSLRGEQALDLAGTGETQRPAAARFSGRRLTALALLSGMMAMILENTLARFLTLTIGGSAQVFSIIVAVFVLAIAAGSFAVARLERLPASLLFYSQAALALLLMGCSSRSMTGLTALTCCASASPRPPPAICCITRPSWRRCCCCWLCRWRSWA